MGFGPSPMEIAIIAVIALIVLGPARLPEMARSVGKGMRELRGAFSGEGGDTSSRKLREADEDEADEDEADEDEADEDDEFADEDDDRADGDPEPIDLDAPDDHDDDDDLEFRSSSSDVEAPERAAPEPADAKPAASA